jgi:hypothetical protein
MDRKSTPSVFGFIKYLLYLERSACVALVCTVAFLCLSFAERQLVEITATLSKVEVVQQNSGKVIRGTYTYVVNNKSYPHYFDLTFLSEEIAINHMEQLKVELPQLVLFYDPHDPWHCQKEPGSVDDYIFLKYCLFFMIIYFTPKMLF